MISVVGIQWKFDIYPLFSPRLSSCEVSPELLRGPFSSSLRVFCDLFFLKKEKKCDYLQGIKDYNETYAEIAAIDFIICHLVKFLHPLPG